MAHDDAPIKDEELDEDAPRRPSPQAGPRRHPDEVHRLRDIPRTELEEHFYMSIENAAAKMNIGLTTLKKLCRQYGIGRWPFRKVQQIVRLGRMMSVRGHPAACRATALHVSHAGWSESKPRLCISHRAAG